MALPRDAVKAEWSLEAARSVAKKTVTSVAAPGGTSAGGVSAPVPGTSFGGGASLGGGGGGGGGGTVALGGKCCCGILHADRTDTRAANAIGGTVAAAHFQPTRTGLRRANSIAEVTTNQEPISTAIAEKANTASPTARGRLKGISFIKPANSR